MSFCELPHEVILNIFSNLSLEEKIGVQRVCQRWYELATCDIRKLTFAGRDEDNAIAIKMVNGDTFIAHDLEQVIKVIKKCNNLNHVEFVDVAFSWYSTCHIKETAASIAKCKTLTIKYYKCDFDDKRLTQLTSRMNCLEEFCIDDSRKLKPRYSKLLTSIIRRNRNITVLHLKAWYLRFNRKLLKPLKLKKLFLYTNISRLLNENLFKPMMLNAALLIILDLHYSTIEIPSNCYQYLSVFSNLKIFGAKININDAKLINFENLETLCLDVVSNGFSNCSEIFLPLLRRNPGLKRIVLLCESVDDKFIGYLCDCCPLLEYLRLHYFSRTLTKKSLQYLLKLSKLWFLRIASEGINDVEMAEFVKIAHSLRELCLCDIWNESNISRSITETYKSFIQKAMLKSGEQFYLHCCDFDDIWNNSDKIPRNLKRICHNNHN